MTMLHCFRLALLFLMLVIVSESFQNGASSRGRRRPISLTTTVPSIVEIRTAYDEQPDDTTVAVAAAFPITACNDAVAVVTNSFQNDSELKTTQFHLLSLQWTPDNIGDDPRRFSKIVTNTWRWKDAALGDGRDYFVPRPKTLRALQSYLLAQIIANANTSFHVKECVIISNCARFEILLELQKESTPNYNNSIDNGDDNDATKHDMNGMLTEIISSALHCQVESFQKLPRFSLLLPVDWPGVINMKANTATTLSNNENNTAAAAAAAASAAAKELSQHWTHYTNLECIMQHLSYVAAGLANRPRRPDRAVVFRPFSSRDAHILLQLKRTVDLFGRCPSTTTKSNNTDKITSSLSSSSYLPKLLRFCLQAGKAARNPTVVPELEQLRVYGTGDDLRYSSDVPLEVQNRVVEAVLTKAIVPIVNKCTADFRAQQSAEQIQELRTSVEQMAATTQELTLLRRYLHDPTLRLRRGEFVDTSALVKEVSIALQASRCGFVVATND